MCTIIFLTTMNVSKMIKHLVKTYTGQKILFIFIYCRDIIVCKYKLFYTIIKVDLASVRYLHGHIGHVYPGHLLDGAG